MFCFQKEELLSFEIRLCQKNLENLKNHKKWIAHLFENKIPLIETFIKYLHLLDNIKIL